jgi:hypothetical protein
MLRVADSMFGFVIPQPTERKNVTEEIHAAFVFAWSNFANVSCHGESNPFCSKAILARDLKRGSD